MVIENKIDYSQVIEMIKEGIFYVIENDEYGSYDNLNVLISNEQFFIRQRKENKLQANTIYIVVKFSTAAVDFGVTVLPLTIIAISEQNNCELCQKLLQDFTTMANMGQNNTETIQQFYESPVVNSNFNEMNEGFRSVITAPGTFVISASANPFDLYWKLPNSNEYKEIYFINGVLDANFKPDPKLFYESNNYTESINTMGTVTFNISVILLTDNGFYDEMLKYITRKKAKNVTKLEKQSNGKIIAVPVMEEVSPQNENENPTQQQVSYEGIDIDKEITFRLNFKNGDYLEDKFVLADERIEQVLKKIPMITFVFTN